MSHSALRKVLVIGVAHPLCANPAAVSTIAHALDFEKIDQSALAKLGPGSSSQARLGALKTAVFGKTWRPPGSDRPLYEKLFVSDVVCDADIAKEFVPWAKQRGLTVRVVCAEPTKVDKARALNKAHDIDTFSNLKAAFASLGIPQQQFDPDTMEAMVVRSFLETGTVKTILKAPKAPTSKLTRGKGPKPIPAQTEAVPA